jgi:hypothetical protein
MNTPTTTVTTASEINRLHEEVGRLSGDSKQSLTGALEAAWKAGHLLIEEKQRVRRTMGRGAWLLWLEQCFHGSPRTAQRYMRLAQTIADISTLQGLSLRQIYFQLGIATEPKSRLESAQARPLPARTRLVTKLLEEIRPCIDARYATAEQWESCRRDLRPLYEQLRRLFETGPAGNVLKKPGFVQANVSKPW